MRCEVPTPFLRTILLRNGVGRGVSNFAGASKSNAANDVESGNGCQIALSFTAANLTNTYEIDTSSSDLITKNQTYTFTVTDVSGLDEGSGLGATWTLEVASLEGSDETVLTFPALSSGTYGGFVSTKEINVVVVGSSRLGVDVDIKKLLGSP